MKGKNHYIVELTNGTTQHVYCDDMRVTDAGRIEFYSMEVLVAVYPLGHVMAACHVDHVEDGV